MRRVDVGRHPYSIRVYASGEITFSNMLCRRMGLKENDLVSLYVSDSPGVEEIYIAKAGIGVEAKQRNGCKQLRINSKDYAELILRGAGSGVFRIGETVEKDGNEYFTVIYKKNYGRKEVCQV